MSSSARSNVKIRRIGSYRLGRRIGAGGMAAVFAARKDDPTGLGRLIALKVMSTALMGDPAFEQMFLREAGITARLEHPNVVRVYEVGEADATLYIAMEFVHGQSLRELTRKTRLPLDIAVQIVVDVARGLHAAHELRDADGKPLGLVHQDVTPHNVMVTFDGITKLLDFGVARLGALEGSRTETIRGKPTYLAPEQVLGGRLDRRTDVFALGIVLFEVFTGDKLFKPKGRADELATLLEQAIPRLHDVAPEVPEAIAAVCDRALQREAEARYPTVRAMTEALMAARREASVAPVDPEALGQWVAQVAPPDHSALELEREIVDAEAQSARAAAVADLPTVHEGSQPYAATETTKKVGSTPDSPVSPPEDHRSETTTAPRDPPASRPADRIENPARRTRWPWAAGFLLLGGMGAFVTLDRSRSTEAAPVSAATATALTAAIPPSAETASHSEEDVDAGQDAAPTDSMSAPSAGPVPSTRPLTPPTPGPLPARPVASAEPAASSPPQPSGEPSAKPPPAKPATLIVGSNEWGAVFVDGVPVGNSPVSIATTPGTHVVMVKTSDGKSQSQSVTTVAGEPLRVRFVF